MGPSRSTWQKVKNPDFDVAIGCIDGAEIAENVGLYLLMRLQEVISKDNMGLYRDDGLAIVKGSGPEVERLQKKIVKIFQEENLKVTMEANTTAVDFLDVVFDLANGNHIPFIKQNENTKDVYMMSSHPPSILKSISTGVCNRLSIISTGEQEFKLEVGHYQYTGYVSKLAYQEKPQPEDEEEQEESGPQQLMVQPPIVI